MTKSGQGVRSKGTLTTIFIMYASDNEVDSGNTVLPRLFPSYPSICVLIIFSVVQLNWMPHKNLIYNYLSLFFFYFIQNLAQSPFRSYKLSLSFSGQPVLSRVKTIIYNSLSQFSGGGGVSHSCVKTIPFCR